MSIARLLLTAALAVGCAMPTGEPTTPPAITFRIDPSGMSVDEQAQAVEAVEAWNCAACPKLTVEIGPAAGVYYSVRHVDRAEMDQIGPEYGGWSDPTGARVVSSAWWQQAVAHEVGHLLGVRHSEAKESVMYWSAAEGSPQVTPQDRAALATAWGDYR